MERNGIISEEALFKVEDREPELLFNCMDETLVGKLIDVSKKWKRTKADISSNVKADGGDLRVNDDNISANIKAAAPSYIKLMGKPASADRGHIHTWAQNTPGLLDQVKKQIKDLTMEDWGYFDLGEIISWMVDTFHQSVGEMHHEGKQFGVYGPTQVGKSGLKRMIQTFGSVFGVAVLIVTKGNDECNDLSRKLKKCVVGKKDRVCVCVFFFARI
jgi:hypothetical protein